MEIPLSSSVKRVGDWKTKDPKLIPYHRYLEEVIVRFRKITFSYMPRTKNKFADALATLASMIKIPEGRDIHPVEIETRDRPAYCLFLEEEFCMMAEDEPDQKPWYHDIKTFIREIKSSEWDTTGPLWNMTVSSMFEPAGSVRSTQIRKRFFFL